MDFYQAQARRSCQIWRKKNTWILNKMAFSFLYIFIPTYWNIMWIMSVYCFEWPHVRATVQYGLNEHYKITNIIYIATTPLGIYVALQLIALYMLVCNYFTIWTTCSVHINNEALPFWFCLIFAFKWLVQFLVLNRKFRLMLWEKILSVSQIMKRSSFIVSTGIYVCVYVCTHMCMHAFVGRTFLRKKFQFCVDIFPLTNWEFFRNISYCCFFWTHAV